MDKQAMQYRNLGNSGLKVSRLGLALGLAHYPLRNVASHNNMLTYNSAPNVNNNSTTGGSAGNLTSSAPVEETSEQIFALAYEAGINYFDTFDPELSGRRSSYAVSIRVHRSGTAETEKGLSRKHIIESVQGSLERLGLSYVDIALAHGRDATSPIEEVVRAFSWIVEKGWAFYWGTCNWTQPQIMEAYAVARLLNLIPPLVDQCEYNFFKRQPVELVIPELYCSIGCGSITFAALANGLLSNDTMESMSYLGELYQSTCAEAAAAALFDGSKPNQPNSRPVSLLELCSSPLVAERYVTDMSASRQKVKLLRPVADQIGASLPQLAIAWCLRTDFVQCCLISPGSLDQLREQILSLAIVDKLTPEVLANIERLLSNQPTLETSSSFNCNPSSTGKSGGRIGASSKNAKDLQNNRRRSVSSTHRKSISSSPRLSISHTGGNYEGRIGIRESVDYSNHDRRPSHI